MNVYHKFYTFHTGGGLITPVYTKMSHSAGDLSDSLLGLMAKQVKLSKGDFLLLVDCPLTYEAYEQVLIAMRIIDPA